MADQSKQHEVWSNRKEHLIWSNLWGQINKSGSLAFGVAVWLYMPILDWLSLVDWYIRLLCCCFRSDQLFSNSTTDRAFLIWSYPFTKTLCVPPQMQGIKSNNIVDTGSLSKYNQVTFLHTSRSVVQSSWILGVIWILSALWTGVWIPSTGIVSMLRWRDLWRVALPMNNDISMKRPILGSIMY